MRKSRFSEEQIISVLKEAEVGVPVLEVCRQEGISDGAFSSVESEIWRAGSERSAGSDGTSTFY